MIVYLASRAASATNGAAVRVDGGVLQSTCSSASPRANTTRPTLAIGPRLVPLRPVPKAGGEWRAIVEALCAHLAVAPPPDGNLFQPDVRAVLHRAIDQPL
jgi:hypothetical protein